MITIAAYGTIQLTMHGRMGKVKKFLEDAEILYNEEIIRDVRKMIIHCPAIAAEAKPGQFVNIQKPGGRTFLRRPFGIADADTKAGTVMIIYRLVGMGTRELAEMKPGEAVSAEGPLGNGVFTLGPGKALLAGGGVGLAPLIFLAKQLRNPIVLVAGKSAAETFWTDFFKPYAEKIYVTTDDGSAGIQGFAVQALPVILEENTVNYVSVCGPTVMMRTMAEAAERAGIFCEVSMEKRMACGIGVCLGCTFESKLSGKRYKVCSDGPVFPAREVF